MSFPTAVRDRTVPLISPPPTSLQELPFQLARLLAGPSEVCQNWPPAKRVPPEFIARVYTSPGDQDIPMPPPTADQALPFHMATPYAATVPAVSKQPPTKRLLLALSLSARPATGQQFQLESLSPCPRADQDVPFHCAIPFTVVAPANVKSPEA
jgi:hypothetical protein